MVGMLPKLLEWLNVFQQSPVPTGHVYTDASRLFGWGGVVLPNHWFQLQWPVEWAKVDITVKELVPIIVAAAVWGRCWRRLHICFHSDNMAVVVILKKRSAKDVVAHHLLCCFYFYTAFSV